MKYINLIFLLAMMMISCNQIKDSQELDRIIIDNEGVMRYASSGDEATFFGVNYTAPFAHAYRALGYLGKDHKEVIDNDVYHISRLGVNAYRIHIWDVEITDKSGNLIENDHLDLLDYLIYKLKERGIYTLVTLQTNFGNGYPERNIPTGGYSYDYDSKVVHSVPEAVEAQKRYAAAIVSHVNKYTGKSYKDDSAIVGFEINNEPKHTVSVDDTRDYIAQMIEAINETGNKKPLFYNVSHNMDHVSAYYDANIQGTTYQWYPIGLVSGATKKGNFLPFVDDYKIPFDTLPGFENKTKAVYEFDPADILYSYMFPATVRTFRSKGFQWITQFTYEPAEISQYNTEYQTHFLNLLYTPGKALGLKIAAEVAYSVKRGERFGTYPNDTIFKDFEVSHFRDLSLMNSNEKYLYSNNIEVAPKNTHTLKEVAGLGNSPIISYTGTGAYLLDKIGDGVWRVEIMPDVVILEDPYSKTSLNRQIAALQSNLNEMEINLPGFERGFYVKGLNKGNNFSLKTTDNKVELTPGVYTISQKEEKVNPASKLGNISVSEYYSPKDNFPINFVSHVPTKIAEQGNDLLVKAQVIGKTEIDSVILYSDNISFWNDVNPSLRLEKKDNFNYEVTVPKSWLYGNKFKYNIVAYSAGKSYTYPGKTEGMPLDWDFTDYKYYEVNLVNNNSAITLQHPFLESEGIEYYCYPSWEAVDKEYYTKKYIKDIITSRTGKLSDVQSVKLKGLWQKDEVNISFISDMGYSYGAKAKRINESEFEVRLSDLRQEPTLLLPLAYPDFLEKRFVPETNIPFNIHNADYIQIHTLTSLNIAELEIAME